MRNKLFSLLIAGMIAVSTIGLGSVSVLAEDAAEDAAVEAEEIVEEVSNEITPSTLDKELKIGFSNFSFTIEYQAKLRDKLQEAVDEKWGGKATLVSTDAELDASKQIADVETLISQNVDAIVLVPLDAEQLVPAIQAAVDAGIPLFEVCLQANDGDLRTSFVGSNDKTSGEMAMEYMAEQLGYKGDIVLLDGIAGMDSNIKRMDGAREVIAKYPDMNIVTEKLCNGSRAEAMAAMENIIQSGKNVDGVFTICDEEALGALAAIQGTDFEGKVMITGIDGDLDCLDAIKAGQITCTSFQDAGLQAIRTVNIIDEYLSGNEIEKSYDVPYQLVTSDNVEDPYWTE